MRKYRQSKCLKVTGVQRLLLTNFRCPARGRLPLDRFKRRIGIAGRFVNIPSTSGRLWHTQLRRLMAGRDLYYPFHGQSSINLVYYSAAKLGFFSLFEKNTGGKRGNRESINNTCEISLSC